MGKVINYFVELLAVLRAIDAKLNLLVETTGTYTNREIYYSLKMKYEPDKPVRVVRVTGGLY